MSDKLFWELISLIDPEQIEEDEQVDLLISKLSKMKIKEIKLFEETLSHKLFLLDTKHAECVNKCKVYLLEIANKMLTQSSEKLEYLVKGVTYKI